MVEMRMAEGVLAPTSPVVVVLLLVICTALLLLVVRMRHWLARLIAGIAVVLVAMSVGIVLVNDSFGYYTTWSDAVAGTFGAPIAPLKAAAPTLAPTASVNMQRRGPLVEPHGRLVAVNLAGRFSRIHRPGLVYLPPQYSNAAYRATRFPVVELLHGTPGGPWNWRDQLHIASSIDSLMAHRAIGPMVFVMPQISVGPAQECLNYGSVRDDTYVSRDVPADILAHYRVSRVAAEWALMGYSSGGYCAANLALRHRGAFGAVASMDGYYWPNDGPAFRRLGNNRRAELANDPLYLAQRLASSTVPLPQFWLSAGTGSADDVHSASTFAAAVQRLEKVSLVLQPGAHHNFYSWRDQVPTALAWVWQAIAPPALRVRFPTGGSVTTTAIRADPRASKYHRRPRTLAKAPPTTVAPRVR